MRAAPAVSVAVAPEPCWRIALATLAWASALTVVGWGLCLALSPGATPLSLLLPWGLLLGLTGGAALRVWRLRRIPVSRLEWDGQAWHATSLAGQASTGNLVAVIDLGAWMLLRFNTTSPVARRDARTLWLAVSERQLPCQWHALRCAVHGRPAAIPFVGRASGPTAQTRLAHDR